MLIINEQKNYECFRSCLESGEFVRKRDSECSGFTGLIAGKGGWNRSFDGSLSGLLAGRWIAGIVFTQLPIPGCLGSRTVLNEIS